MLTQKDIIFEDNHLIAINKLPGVLSQGDKTGDESVFDQVKEYIVKRYNKPGDAYLGLLHRIDRPVSGVLIFGKTSKATARMNLLFQKREVQKTYHALVEGVPEKDEDQLVHYLIKDSSSNKSKAFNHEVKKAKKAELNYRLLAHIGKLSLLEIKPKTGRHHQIRCQLAKIKCHIKGDVKYGANRANKDKSICLHSYALEFIHPVKKEKVRIEAKYPDNGLWQEF